MRQIIQIIPFLLLFTSINIYSQNLIPNHSFELSNTNGKCGAGIEITKDWQGINTVDLHNIEALNCESTVASHQNNLSAVQYGDYFAGLRIRKAYREFLYVKLTDSLEKNKKYLFSMYVKTRKGLKYYLKNFGISFTADNPGRKHESLYRIPVIQIILNSINPFTQKENYNSKNQKTLKNYEEWKKIEIEYTASGTENYLIIGYFLKNKEMFKVKSTRKLTNEAYYFIDNLSLMLINDLQDIKIE